MDISLGRSLVISLEEVVIFPSIAATGIPALVGCHPSHKPRIHAPPYSVTRRARVAGATAVDRREPCGDSCGGHSGARDAVSDSFSEAEGTVEASMASRHCAKCGSAVLNILKHR